MTGIAPSGAREGDAEAWTWMVWCWVVTGLWWVDTGLVCWLGLCVAAGLEEGREGEWSDAVCCAPSLQPESTQERKPHCTPYQHYVTKVCVMTARASHRSMPVPYLPCRIHVYMCVCVCVCILCIAQRLSTHLTAGMFVSTSVSLLDCIPLSTCTLVADSAGRARGGGGSLANTCTPKSRSVVF